MLNYTNPIVSDFYDNEYYLSLEYRYFSDAHRTRLSALMSALGDISGKKILDFGGGAGYVANKMQQNGAQVIVGDFSKAAIQWGRERFPAMDFRLLDVADIINVDERFDIVTAFDVVEHLEEPEMLLNAVKNVLKPDGRLFISTDNIASPFYTNRILKRLDTFLMRFGREGHDYGMIKRVEKYRRNLLGKDYHCSHISEFSFDSLQSLLKKNGFQIEYFRTHHLWSNWVKNLITGVLGDRAGTSMVFCCAIVR